MGQSRFINNVDVSSQQIKILNLFMNLVNVIQSCKENLDIVDTCIDKLGGIHNPFHISQFTSMCCFFPCTLSTL